MILLNIGGTVRISTNNSNAPAINKIVVIKPSGSPSTGPAPFPPSEGRIGAAEVVSSNCDEVVSAGGSVISGNDSVSAGVSAAVGSVTVSVAGVVVVTAGGSVSVGGSVVDSSVGGAVSREI